MIALILLTLLLAFVIVSWVFLIRDAKSLSLDGPFPLPVLGNGHYFLGNSAKFLTTLQDFTTKYGAVCRFYIVSKRHILSIDPKFMEAITSNTAFNTKGDFYRYGYPWVGSGLLTANGERWKTHRRLLTPAFHFNILQSYFPVFLKNSKLLTSKLRKVGDGKPIDLFPIISLYALDNITESIMGVSLNAQSDSESEYVKASEAITSVLSMRMRNPFGAADVTFNLMPQKAVQDKALKILHGQSKKVIQARRKTLEESHTTSLNYASEDGIKNKHAFLDLLLLSEVDGKKIEDEKIREEVDTFLFAGHDTTTSGTSFTLFCISKYEDVQRKLLEEQLSILGDDPKKDPTYSDLSEMKYLESVIKESLRLYPPAPMIGREITQDSEIAGTFIPKDTTVILDIFHWHRSPEAFENPLEFRPERFESNLRSSFSWVAFSAGSRNCIGQKFAMMGLKTTISEIIRNFELIPSGVEPILKADLTLRSGNGIYVSFVPRK